ncbi:glycosyltransferase family 2 protein [Jaapia argillacea MUCL 33604]|uniref:dolichyl-phosphate beta-glucosyltransferase n=1 Tax=Jaapia argillacea MUCL 33604 TaxID=933084 RepID=A0A067Q338_9AGAM|nr:glycosyltransferase family 2 protein [Jaapia argillacea MUCL 33604]
MVFDQNTLLYGGLSFVAATAVLFYSVLLIWSPPPIPERESEKKYRSKSSPSKPVPLPSIRDAASVDLTVVIPAFNETSRMPSMLESTINHLSQPHIKKSRKYEILIVDDGSSDGTSELALKLAVTKYGESDIRVVKLEKNLGKGGAVRHGMMHGRGKRLLMVDADGASRFEDLESLWKSMDTLSPDDTKPAITIGSRAHLVKTEAVVKRSLLRNILMYGLHTVLRVVGVGHIRDTQCGFKLFNRPAAVRLFPAQHLTTWIFDVELLLLAKQMGIPVAEVPIEWHEVPGSKLNVMLDSLQMLRDLLIMRGNQMLGRWKPTAWRT